MFRPGPPLDERELPPRFRFGRFEADLPATRVYREGEAVPLEPRAFDLLLLLAANPRRVVVKEEIFERLWGNAFVTDNALTRVVAQLRQQLGDRAESPSIIETVRTRGYRFLPAIEAVEETSASLPAPAGAAPLASAGQAAAPGPLREPAPVAGDRAPGAAPPGGVVAWRLRRLGPWFLAGALLTTAVLVTSSRWRSAAGLPGASAAAVQRTTESGIQLHPDYSPDGNLLVYAGDAGDGIELFVRPVEGGRALQLTSDGPNTEPAWSPDGRWIAYRNQRVGGLWLVAPTGGEVRQLLDFGTQPAWSPDSATIAFAHPGKVTLGALEWPAVYDSAIWLVDVASGQARQLTRPSPESGGQGMPAFSPDGRWVVYAAATLVHGGSLWRVPSAGGEPAPLVRPTPPGEGEWLLWHDPQPLPGGDGVYAIRVAGDSRVLHLGWTENARVETVLSPALPGTVHLALRRDGRQLAFAVEEAETAIEEVAVDERGEVAGPPRVLYAPTARRVFLPKYSPDGRRLLILQSRGGSRTEGVVVDTDGREQRVVERGRHAKWISPTEVAILGVPAECFRIDVSTGRRRLLSKAAWIERAFAAASPRGLDFRPDLGALAFTAQARDGRELMLWEAGAEQPRALTRLGAWVDYPFWSRDGRKVAFQLTSRLQLGNELWEVAPAGGGPRRIRSAAGPSWGGAFSPDGCRVVYAAFRDGRWHLAVAGTADEERRLAVPAEVRGYLRWPDWSPDGGRIAYERMRYRTNVWTLDLAAAR